MDLARVLRADTAWTAAWLTRLGIEVDAGGCFNPEELRRVLDHVPAVVGSRAKVDAESRLEMGRTQESARLWLVKKFEAAGLHVIHRQEKRFARFTLQRDGGDPIWCSTYVGFKTKSHGQQIGFTVTESKAGRYCEWAAFVSVPWGTAYLKNREEMKTSWITRHPGEDFPKRWSVTFSIGSDVDAFERRVPEVK